MTDGPVGGCARGGAGLSAERLSAFGDGDLPAVELASVRRHLDECPACARRAAELGALARAARTLEAPEAPPTLWPAIQGALDHRSWWTRPWRPFGVGALVGAAVAALALFALRSPNVSPSRRDEGRELRAASPREARGARGPASGSEPGPRQTDPLLAEAEAEIGRAAAAYERSIEKLRGLVAREEGAWSADARARYADRLARLDDAIARSREAARRGPSDDLGHEALFAAYQDKITFLAEAAQRGGGSSPEWGEAAAKGVAP